MEIRNNNSTSSYLYLASMPYSGWKASVEGRTKNAGHFDQGYHDNIYPPVPRGWVKVVYTGAPISVSQPYAIKTKILPIGSWDIHDQNINVPEVKYLNWSSFGVNANRVTYFKALINGDQNGSSGATSRYTDLHRKSVESDFSTSDGLGDNSGAYAMIDQQISPSQAYMRVHTFGNDYFSSGYYDWENPSVNRGFFRVDYLAASCNDGTTTAYTNLIIGYNPTANDCHGNYTTTAAGAIHVIQNQASDIWGNSDQCAFTYNSRTAGNFTATVRVDKQAATSAWAKAGVMIRTGLGASSPEVSMLVTPGNGAQLTVRYTNPGATTHPYTNTQVAPLWLRLVKSGNNYTGWTSADGTSSSWKQLGSTLMVTTGSTYYVGSTTF